MYETEILSFYDLKITHINLPPYSSSSIKSSVLKAV